MPDNICVQPASDCQVIFLATYTHIGDFPNGVTQRRTGSRFTGLTPAKSRHMPRQPSAANQLAAYRKALDLALSYLSVVEIADFRRRIRARRKRHLCVR
jgi:hypothetical protein